MWLLASNPPPRQLTINTNTIKRSTPPSHYKNHHRKRKDPQQHNDPGALFGIESACGSDAEGRGNRFADDLGGTIELSHIFQDAGSTSRAVECRAV